jgi:vancomycin resistance protein YoaR
MQMEKEYKDLVDGNCQVSSTLYNAVANTPGLTVVERHNHSNDVHYVPLGQDAAISYASNIDFKFKNDTNDSITILAECSQDQVTVKIKGYVYE